MKFISPIVLLLILISGIKAETEPYSIHLEQITIPGSPKIHSFAFADYNGKWLFVGGRINGMHGFDGPTSFPKQYSNKNIFVVDPQSQQTYSRNIFSNLNFAVADPLRSTNMQYYFDGSKLYITGGFGYDSTSNGLLTFPALTVIDVPQIIQAIIDGTSIAPYVRQINDERMRVCGGEMYKLGEYFYLVGGHNFTGSYTTFVNDQVYTNQLRKFKITDNISLTSITDYSSLTDTVNLHRRDMNLVPAIRPDGVSKYLILYGGVFRYDKDLPFLNPVYIDESGAVTDNSFEQKMSQYTCSFFSAFNSADGSMHTTFLGGTSLYYYDEVSQMQIRDTLVPFINDVTTLTKKANGVSAEVISDTKMPALLGTNAKFIINPGIPKYDNGVIRLNEISGKTFIGYVFGGIRAFLPNNTPSFPSEYIFKVHITPQTIGINTISANSPGSFNLHQNFPNPFNPVTKIRFEIPESQNVKLTVFNSLGEKVTELVNREFSPGIYETEFSSETAEGSLSSGVYYFNLTAETFSETKKMLLLK